MAMVRRRRRRKPRWIGLALILTLIVLAVNAAVNGRDPEPSRRLERLAYLDVVRPLVQDSTDQGTELAGLRDKAAELGRAGITRRLDRLKRETAAVVESLQAASPPDSMAGTNSLLMAAMVARSRSVTLIDRALMSVLGTDLSDASVNDLVQAGADLETADRTYALFLRSLPSGEGKEAALPSSVWIADGQLWQVGAITAFVTTLRSSETLAAVHDVGIVLVNTDPAAITREGDADIFAAGSTLRLQIVVANVGNEAEKKVPVVASLTGADGTVDTAKDTVNLAPGQRLTVTLSGLKPPPSQPVTLTVSIGPIVGETETDTNVLDRQLIFR